MPIISLDEELDSLDAPSTQNILSNAPLASRPEGEVAPKTPETSGPSGLSIAASALRENNPVSSLLYNQKRYSDRDPNFSAWPLIEGTSYENNWQSFVRDNNDEDVRNTMAQLDQEKRDRDVLSESGWLGTVSSVAAAVTDPTMLVPGINIVKGAKAARIVKNAVGGAVSAAGAVAASEAVLTNTQELRTADDGIFNTAAAAVIGGVLGAGVAAWVTKGEVEGAKAGVKSVLNGDVNKAGTIKPVEVSVSDTSAGAAQVPYTRYKVVGLHDQIIKNSQVPVMHSPSLDMLTDTFEATRKTGQGLFENRFYLGEKSDVAVETLNRLDSVELYNLKKSVDDQYKTYVGSKTSLGTEGYIRAKSSGKLTYSQFSEEIAKSMRRGDSHTIPQVANAVKILREQSDKVTAQLQKIGILGEQLDLKGARSWLSRVWNKDAITQDRFNFTAKLKDDFIRQGTPDEKALEEADKVYDAIVNGQDDLSILQNKGITSLETGKPFIKDRTLNINDAEYERWLKNDGMYIMENYIKEAKSIIRMKEYLNKNNETGIKSILDRLDSEYSLRSAQLTGKAAVKMKNNYKKAQQRIRDSFQIMLGKYRQRSKYDDILGALNKYQYVRLLTFQVLGSLTDVSNPIMKYGFGKTLMHGYVSALAEFTGGVSKLARADLKTMGVGMELEMNTTVRSVMDPGFYENANSRLNKYGNSATDAFSIANGSVFWNNFHKRLTGRIVEHELSKLIMKKTPLTTKEEHYLNIFAIGAPERELIAKELKAYQIKVPGASVPNIKAWKSPEAQELFSAAVLKEVESTILGGAGRSDMPWIMQKYQLASTVALFKGFFSALNARVILPALQAHDANTAQGILGLVTLGAAQYVIREKLKGREPNLEPNKLIMEGISRGGVLGMWTDPAFGLIFKPYTGVTRYSSTPRLDSILLGPSFSMANDLAALYGSASTTNWTDTDTDKAFGLLPFSHVWKLRKLFDQLN